jgi:branched-chain amino acid transport system substrate-binding protein
MKKVLALVGGLCLILILAVMPFMAACAPTPPAPPAPPTPPAQPIKIGAIVPLTGGLAHYGPHTKAGIEVALDEAGWKVAGRPIELIIEDDASFDEVMALQKARKLVEVDKVDVLMGPIASSSFLGTETYIDVKQIPTLAIGYRGELKEWVKPSWDFASNGGLAQITYQAGIWAYEQGFRTAVTMGPDYETGYQGCGGFADGFTKAGGKVVQQLWSPVGTTDYAPYFATMQKADLMAMFQYGAGVTSFVKQWHEFGFWDKEPLMLLINDSLLGPSLAELGDFTIGLHAATNYSWTIDNPVNKKFVAAFEAKTGMKPEPPAWWAYTATTIFLAIMEKTNGDTTPEVMRNALFGLTVDTPSGPVTFDGEKGYSRVNAFITEVQKVEGQLAYKVIKTYPATINPGYYTKP